MYFPKTIWVWVGVLLFVAAVDGSAERLVASPHFQDSPGAVLVLVHGIRDDGEYVHRCISVNPDGSGQQILARDTPLYGEYHPICDFRYLAELAPDGSGWLHKFRYPHDTYDDDEYALQIRSEGKDPIILDSFVDKRLSHPAHHCRWCASWLPDSQQVLFWDEDMGLDEYRGMFLPLGIGRLRLLDVDPVLDTRIAVFTNGLHQPVRALTADGQTALAISPDGAQVLFRTGESDTMTLDTIHLDGSGIDTLVDTGPVGQCAGWSPDSRQVIYSRQHESGNTVEIVDANGSEQVVLAQGHNPVWSPDGQQIAFNCPVGGRDGVCLVAPDGSGLRELPLAYDGQAMSPYWSPDGRKLAFNGQRPAPDSEWRDVETYDFIIYDLESQQAQVLTSNVSPWVWECGDVKSAIRWSPDGQWVLYSYHEPIGHAGATEAGSIQYFLCSPEGCQEIGEIVGIDSRDFIMQVRWMPVR